MKKSMNINIGYRKHLKKLGKSIKTLQCVLPGAHVNWQIIPLVILDSKDKK